MLIFYLLLFALTLWGVRWAGKGFLPEECLSRSVTDSVKGVFIILVFLSHFAGYVTYVAPIDKAGKSISAWLGQLIVTCFLFYSGYGVCEAIQKRGAAYVFPFPKNRIGKTLLHFDVAVLLFLVVRLCLGKTFSLKNILLSLVAWESLGNSNWYIFAVLMLYLITWLAFLLVQKHHKYAAVLVTVLTVGYIVVLRAVRPRDTWWFDTVLCYPLGMWVSLLRRDLLRWLTKSNAVYGVSVLGLLAAFLATHHLRSAIGGEAWLPLQIANGMLFCLLLTAVFLKVKVGNRLLEWCGQYTFELFILQRIPMLIFKAMGIAEWNIYIFFVLSLGATVGLAFGFRYCTDRLDRLLFAKKK